MTTVKNDRFCELVGFVFASLSVYHYNMNGARCAGLTEGATMKSSQIKVFSFGRWSNFGAPRAYHEAVDLAAELLAAGVIAAVVR